MARPPDDGLEKVPDAAQAWAGGLHPKTLYAAIRAGKLKAAHIGAGRNLLVCEAFIDAWLNAATETKSQATPVTVPVRRRA